MTRERLEELNEVWEAVDSITKIINLFRNIEGGGIVSTAKNQEYLPPDVVERLLRTMWEYHHNLSEKFKEM